MILKKYLLCLCAFSILCCDPNGSETGCHLKPSYDLDLHGITFFYLYDISLDKEIINASLKTNFAFQYDHWKDIVPVIFPYNKYYINSISFPTADSITIDFKNDSSNTFSYIRNDCQITVESSDPPLNLSLMDSGEKISESRLAIFDHDRTITGKDTFLFLGFIIAPNVPVDKVIKNFILDHPGSSDTIGLQSVFNEIRD